MDIKKNLLILFVVVLAGLFLFFAANRQTDIEFLCAANGISSAHDTSVAIVGQNGYYTENGALMSWNLATGSVTQVCEEGVYKLRAYNDELYYYNREAVMVWNPLTDTHKALYPAGQQSIFDFFLFHNMLFCMTLEGITVFDIRTESVVLTLDGLSVIDITEAVMNDELYLLITDFPENSSLLKYNEQKQCFELMESGLIQMLYNTGEKLIYQRSRDNWSSSAWMEYQQGRESCLEIDLGRIIGTTPKGIVFTRGDYKFSYWDGESVIELDVPVHLLKSPHMVTYICTGTHFVIIDRLTHRVYTVALD